MMNPKISVIVAVYNAEKHLSRCLDSLLSQTFEDFEIVLVDDGSCDRSANICDEYAFRDKRFKVVHKKNGGVASARQCGLNNSLGEYVIHVDSDDWVEADMLASLYESVLNSSADILICDYFEHLGEKSVYVKQQPTSLKNTDVLNDFFHDLQGYCWNKLIRKKCFEDYNIDFPPNMVVWEDLYVCVNLVVNRTKISYLPKAYYHYIHTHNENSLVKAVSQRKVNSMAFFIDFCEKKFFNYNENMLILNKIVAKRNAFLLDNIKRKEFIQFYSEVNEQFILKFDNFRKIDSLIRFSLKYSWFVARLCLKIWKLKK